MELGLKNPYMVWFLGPNSIMALRLDPLGYNTRHMAVSKNQGPENKLQIVGILLLGHQKRTPNG